MATGKFSKFVRPEEARPAQTSDRDLDILDAVLRYRFCSAAQIVRLVGGNEDVTHRRLRGLWERGLIARWAFPGFRTHSEFYYYLDNREPLDLLADRRGLEIHGQMLEEIKSHREKDYAGAAIRGQHMQLGFLNHSLMISRMHFMIEMACRKSVGSVSLEAWCQGGQIAGHKVAVPKVRSSKVGGEFFWEEIDETERLPVEPDALFTLRFAEANGGRLAHFCYEADRGTMVAIDMLRKMAKPLRPLPRQFASFQSLRTRRECQMCHRKGRIDKIPSSSATSFAEMSEAILKVQGAPEPFRRAPPVRRKVQSPNRILI
jgi:hypothetical protein